MFKFLVFLAELELFYITVSIVGVSVLILLALICIIMSLIILLARVFGHAKGRARLAAGSSFTAGLYFHNFTLASEKS